MTLIAPKPNSLPRMLPPEGSHAGRCIGLIQLGTIEEEYLGEIKWLDKIWLTFELTNELAVFKEGEDLKPFLISKEYTHSMGMKSNLRPIVEGIIGTHLHDEEAYNFDLEQLVSKSCLITVQQGETKSGNKSAWIKTTAPLPKGMSVPPPVNPLKVMTYEKWDQEYFNSLPNFLKEKMIESKQYQKKFIQSDGIDSSEIPF